MIWKDSPWGNPGVLRGVSGGRTHLSQILKPTRTGHLELIMCAIVHCANACYKLKTVRRVRLRDACTILDFRMQDRTLGCRILDFGDAGYWTLGCRILDYRIQDTGL